MKFTVGILLSVLGCTVTAFSGDEPGRVFMRKHNNEDYFHNPHHGHELGIKRHLHSSKRQMPGRDHEEGHSHHSCGCGCNCNCQNVFFRYSGSRLPTIGPDGEFTYIILGNYTSNDGSLSIQNHKLVVDSNPFTSTQTNVLDNLKYVIHTNQEFELPNTGEISFSAEIGGACFNVGTQPFGSQAPDPESDLRLAAGAFNVFDFTNGFIFDFLITNKKIYALYKRVDVSRGILGNYAAFDFAVPVADNEPGKSHRYSINFNVEEQSVRWILDGKEVYKTYSTGSLLSRQYMVVDLGGHQEFRFPKKFQVGFGLFTVLDGYSPCNVQVPTLDGGHTCQFPANEQGLVQLAPTGAQKNPRNGIQNATYVEDGTNPNYRIWGQGCILTVEEITVGYCKQPKMALKGN